MTCSSALRFMSQASGACTAHRSVLPGVAKPLTDRHKSTAAMAAPVAHRKFHASADKNPYMRRDGNHHLSLSVEHRAA